MPILIKDALGATQTIEAPNVNGRAPATASGPVVLSTEDSATLGSTTETAPTTDTASSGLNGRLQRIAQRLSSLITAIGTPLQNGGAVSVSNFPATQAITATALPLPMGAATSAGITSLITAVGSPLQAGGTVQARAYDANGVALKSYINGAGEATQGFTSLRTYFSDDFGGTTLDTARWDVFDGGLGAVTQSTGAQTAIGTGTTGITHAVANSALSVVMGTTLNAEKWFLSKQVFGSTEDILMTVAKSNWLAANSIQIGLVEVDPSTGFPIQNTAMPTEFTNKAVQEFGQTTSAINSGLRTIGDNSPAEYSQNFIFTVGVQNVTFESILQVRAEDVHLISSNPDSSTLKVYAFRASTQVPNPNKIYKLILRFKNVSTPASSTVFTIHRMMVQNHHAVQVAIAEGSGHPSASQSTPVNVTNPLPVGSNTIGGIVSHSGFSDTSTPLASGATFTGTVRQTFYNAGFGYFGVFAYSDVAGTIFIDHTQDGTTWREAASAPLQAGTVGFRADLSTRVRGSQSSINTMYRVRFVNGATAQAAFALSSSFTVA